MCRKKSATSPAPTDMTTKKTVTKQAVVAISLLFFYDGNVFPSLLFRAKNAVTGIAQTGQDVAVFIQTVIEGGCINLDIGVFTVQALYPFRSCDQTNELDVFDSPLLEQCNRCRSAATSSQHRIDDD